MPNGGNIYIQTEMKDDDGEENILISVRDDGMGMSPETLDQIFSPYSPPNHRGWVRDWD